MAHNYYVDKSLLDLLEKEIADLLEEEEGRNQNCRNDDAVHEHPDAPDHEIHPNYSLESDRNFPASGFSRETRIASCPETQCRLQGLCSSFDISTSASLAGAQQGTSETIEENPANSFIAPFEAARGDFCRTDDNQSKHSEPFSNQQNIGGSNRRSMQKKRHRNASFGAEDSTCRKKGNKSAEFFPRTKTSHSDSAWPPHISAERDRNEAMAQTAEEYRELRIASSIFSPIDDIPSFDMATQRVSLGSAADAEAVPVAGPSEFHTLNQQTGKEKLFKCDVCGRTFGREDHLDDHNRTHTGETPFKCNTCGRGFTNKGNLTKHIRTHTGEKRFVCDICGKRFAQKAHRDSHLPTHSEEKPFKCKFCDKGFACKNSCNRHQKTQHGGNVNTLHIK